MSTIDEYKAQLLVVEAKLAKEPTNEEYLEYKAELEAAVELLEETAPQTDAKPSTTDHLSQDRHHNHRPSGSRTSQDSHRPNGSINNNLVPHTSSASSGGDDNSRRPVSELDLLAKKKEKNRKKKAKLREKLKEQSEIAEGEKNTWQSFASKKGLKGITKKSIFASPHSLTGKVGVGTNGIADAPPAQIINAKVSKK